MADIEPAGWIRDALGAWTRTLHPLLLRVWSDPDESDEPWTWEMLLEDADDAAEYEIGLGGAESRDTAIAQAEAAARAYAGR
jgi:hypothetical protein